MRGDKKTISEKWYISPMVSLLPSMLCISAPASAVKSQRSSLLPSPGMRRSLVAVKAGMENGHLMQVIADNPDPRSCANTIKSNGVLN